jgi:type IV secretion system protein VirB11
MEGAIDFRKREQERERRVYEMLLSSMGPLIERLLEDDDVCDITLNPDGRLWVDRLGSGREFTGETMAEADAERIIRIVASGLNTVCNTENPILSAELPGTGSRFQGLLPPVVEKPSFAIRKHAIRVFTLDDYVKDGIMSEGYTARIRQAVKDRENILIVGGTGSGKTTLANAILDEIAGCNDRVVIIEDTLELQCRVDDFVSLRTKDGVVGMTELLKATLRLRPDRIVVGEVRGGEALALLKAWNTGHPGGLSTVHANGPRQGLVRLEQLIQEAAAGIPRALIAEAVDLVVYIERCGAGRRVDQMAEVMGCEDDSYILQNEI